MATGITPNSAPNTETSLIYLQLGTSSEEGAQTGKATTDLISFYGATPIAQRNTVALTQMLTTSSLSSTQANAIISAVNELMTTLQVLGLHG